MSDKKGPKRDLRKTFVDTSVIVEIDRGNTSSIELCKYLTSSDNALISTVTVSEILTGSYLRTDYTTAVSKAERVLGQFSWIPLNGVIAKLVAQLNAYLISKGLPIEYQDVVIAASCLVENCDVLLTENKDHFLRFPRLRGKVMTEKELHHSLHLETS